MIGKTGCIRIGDSTAASLGEQCFWMCHQKCRSRPDCSIVGSRYVSVNSCHGRAPDVAARSRCGPVTGGAELAKEATTSKRYAYNGKTSAFVAASEAEQLALASAKGKRSTQ
ncbi:hypothetical protein VTH82DRAFT_1878 [Thermothelomyces myriococcoides]